VEFALASLTERGTHSSDHKQPKRRSLNLSNRAFSYPAPLDVNDVRQAFGYPCHARQIKAHMSHLLR